MFSANAIVVIPVYKEMNDWEKVSLKQMLKVLNKSPFCLIAPDSLDVSSYFNYHQFRVERFPDGYFSSKTSYSELMLLPDLYRRFEEFEYMLVCQLDVFVFSDKLKDFCGKGYDYIGAPVPRYAPVWKDIGVRVGNGGCSLRKISSVLRVLEKKEEIYKKYPAYWEDNKFKLWEDVFFAYCSTILELNFNTPSVQVALEFAVENDVGHVYRQMPANLPFCCHAWWVTNYWHWKPIIESFGYSLPIPSVKQLKKVRNSCMERYAIRRLLRHDNIYTCRTIASKIFTQNKYVIWGYGVYGRMVFNLLDSCGKKVSAVIDNNVVEKNKCADIPLLNSDTNFINKIRDPIIVATLKYEDEIIENEVPDTMSQNVIRLSWILEMILNRYVELIRWGCIC